MVLQRQSGHRDIGRGLKGEPVPAVHLEEVERIFYICFQTCLTDDWLETANLVRRKRYMY